MNALLILLALIPLQSRADARCDELNTFWKNEGHHDLKVEGTYVRFECPSVESDLAEAALLLKSYSQVSEIHYYENLLKELKRLSFEPTEKPANPATAAYHPPSIIIHPYFQRLVKLDRVGTLIHEGWHLAHSKQDHVDCKSGPWKNVKKGCDAKWSLGENVIGSYNAQIAFYLSIAKTKSYGILGVMPSDVSLAVWSILFQNFNSLDFKELVELANTTLTVSSAAYCALRFPDSSVGKTSRHPFLVCKFGVDHTELACPHLPEEYRSPADLAICKSVARVSARGGQGLIQDLVNRGLVNGLSL